LFGGGCSGSKQTLTKKVHAIAQGKEPTAKECGQITDIIFKNLGDEKAFSFFQEITKLRFKHLEKNKKKFEEVKKFFEQVKTKFTSHIKKFNSFEEYGFWFEVLGMLEEEVKKSEDMKLDTSVVAYLEKLIFDLSESFLRGSISYLGKIKKALVANGLLERFPKIVKKKIKENSFGEFKTFFSSALEKILKIYQTKENEKLLKNSIIKALITSNHMVLDLNATGKEFKPNEAGEISLKVIAEKLKIETRFNDSFEKFKEKLSDDLEEIQASKKELEKLLPNRSQPKLFLSFLK